jgi:hypothetical protein
VSVSRASINQTWANLVVSTDNLVWDNLVRDNLARVNTVASTDNPVRVNQGKIPARKGTLPFRRLTTC